MSKMWLSRNINASASVILWKTQPHYDKLYGWTDNHRPAQRWGIDDFKSLYPPSLHLQPGQCIEVEWVQGDVTGMRKAEP